jgi:hypothetical protein
MIRLLFVLVLCGSGFVGAGCTNRDSDAGTESTLSAASSTTVSPPETSETGEGAASTSATSPTVAEAGGWRLAVIHPMAGATIGRVTTMCVEVGGTSREPVVALEVRLLEPGASSGGEAVRVDGAVGRVPVEIALPQTPPGRYDLRVQLLADGAHVDGVAVTIPDVSLTDDAPDAACA